MFGIEILLLSLMSSAVFGVPLKLSAPAVRSLPAAAHGRPEWPPSQGWHHSSNSTNGTCPGLGDTYKMYTGDGTTAQGWPAQTAWADFNVMWKNNQALIKTSCSLFGEANNSQKEINDIFSAIRSVSFATQVDARFILAIIMQESKGCVRVPTSFGTVVNPGLMQDYDGLGTCNVEGSVQNPCPASMIEQMILDGTAGTYGGDGPGLMHDLIATGASGVSKYYKAARIYNSGSIPPDGNLSGPGATRCYASDIANRLTGWTQAPSKCDLD